MVLTRLKAVMEAKNISSEELAAKTFMSARSIDKAKSGRGISINSGKRIANGLHIKLEEIV